VNSVLGKVIFRNCLFCFKMEISGPFGSQRYFDNIAFFTGSNERFFCVGWLFLLGTLYATGNMETFEILPFSFQRKG